MNTIKPGKFEVNHINTVQVMDEDELVINHADIDRLNNDENPSSIFNLNANNVKKIIISSNVKSINVQLLEKFPNLEKVIINASSETEKRTKTIQFTSTKILTKKIYHFPINSKIKEIIMPNGSNIMEKDYTQHKILVIGIYIISLKRINQGDVLNLNGTDGMYLQRNEYDHLTSITISADNVIKHRLSNFRNLKKITINSKSNTIGSRIFSDCQNLEEIHINFQIEKIEEYAFKGCIKLKLIKQEYCGFDASFSALKLKDGTLTLKNIKNVGSNAFEDCKLIKQVVINGNGKNIQEKSYKTLGQNVFRGCTALEKAEFYNLNDPRILVGGLFQNCTSLIQVIFPLCAESIGIKAFNNTALEEVILPENLKTISASAFEKCKKIKKVTIHDKVKTIYERAFKECESLEVVRFNINKTEIEMREHIFIGCANLKFLIFASSQIRDFAQKKIKSAGTYFMTQADMDVASFMVAIASLNKYSKAKKGQKTKNRPNLENMSRPVIKSITSMMQLPSNNITPSEKTRDTKTPKF